MTPVESWLINACVSFSLFVSLPVQRTTRKTLSAPTLTIDQVLELSKVKTFFFLTICSECVYQICVGIIIEHFNSRMQTAPLEEVQKEVEGLLSRADMQDLQPSVGQLASTLVSRGLADPTFYTSSTLVQLVHTQSLCHRSVWQ